MEQEKNYRVIITDEKILVFLIKKRKTEPQDPFLFYDGKRHAVLHRSKTETIILDWLNEQLIPILTASNQVIIFETDDHYEQVFRSYFAPITQTA